MQKKIFLGILTILLFNNFLLCKTSSTAIRHYGETFKILEYPQGIGTLLFFHLEDDRSFDQMKFDLARLQEKYGDKLRLVLIDIKRRENLLTRHRVTDIPTIILFNKKGTEIYRWLPNDLQFGLNAKEVEDKLKRLE